MKNEISLIYDKVKSYFNDLGYSDSSYIVDWDISNTDASMKRIDFAIVISNSTQIIVEVKSGEISNELISESLKYDPVVRQAQRYSHDVNAKYFVVTDSINYLWFVTGNDGRPAQISPVRYDDISIPAENAINTEREFRHALKICMKILSQNNASDNTDNIEIELLILLIARYYFNDDAIGNLDYHEVAVSSKIKSIIQEHLNSPQIVSKFSIDEKSIVECYQTLSNIDFSRLTVEIAKSSLDDILQISTRRRIYKIPEKLSKLMISLVSQPNEAFVLDPWANYGDFLRLFTTTHPSAIFTAIFSTTETWLYSIYLELIAKRPFNNVRLLSQSKLLDRKFMKNEFNYINTIITALPFGSGMDRNITDELQFAYFEDYLIDLSLNLLSENGRLIAIVPESFLFNGGKRSHIRQFLVNRYSLKAIISLPNGTLSSSNVKSSVIVIDKTKSLQNDVFMGIVESDDNAVIMNNKQDDGSYDTVFKYLKEYLDGKSFFKNAKSIAVVPEKKLQENLSAASYLVKKIPEIVWGNTVKLSEVCHDIRKGRAIRLNSTGNKDVLGPASIRPLILETSSFDKTDKIPENAIYSNKDDIIINNIGKYMGAAAIVHNVGVPISQHVYALTPNKNLIIPEYLAIVINNNSVQEYFRQAATGSVMPSIKLSFLREALIPLPSLEQQKKIVTAVNRKQDDIKTLNEKLINTNLGLQRIIDTLEAEEDK